MKVSARERRLLGVLGVLALVAFGRYLLGALDAAFPSPGREAATAGKSVSAARGATTPKFGRGARVAPRVAPRPDEVELLASERLEARPPEEFEIGRDLFRFGPPPPPPPPLPPSPEELERRRLAEEERLRRLADERREAAIPKPPPLSLKYLGSFGTAAQRIAVLSDESGENLYNVRQGEIIEQKFIVDHIGFESVDIKFVGFPEHPAERLSVGG